MTTSILPNFDFSTLDASWTRLYVRLNDPSSPYRRAQTDGALKKHFNKILIGANTNRIQVASQPIPSWDYGDDAYGEEVRLFEWVVEGIAELKIPLAGLRIPNIGSLQNAIENINAYFVAFRDASGSVIIGVKEAKYLKGVSRKKFALVDNGILILNESPVFQLAESFDFVYDNNLLFVFEAKAFSRIIRLDTHITALITANVATFVSDAPWIKWPGMKTYIEAHSRAAGRLQSIIARGELSRLDVVKLRSLLNNQNIPFVEPSAGIIEPANGKEGLFLDVLDHRIFSVEMTADPATSYRAANRSKL